MKSKTTLVDFFAGLLIGGLIIKWYAHLFLAQHFGYWLCVGLAIPFGFIRRLPLGKTVLLLWFIIALTVQMLAWGGIVKLPLIK